MRVKLFDRKLLEHFYGILSAISVLTSLLLIVIDIPSGYKLVISFFSVVILISIYIFLWCKANHLKSIEFLINDSPVEIVFGDIFTEDGLKVIAFNEFFDTQVVDRLVPPSTINGTYLTRYITDIAELDNCILEDDHLRSRITDSTCERSYGKKIKYKLGSIIQKDDFLLTAFAHLDNENRSYLSMRDFIEFLIEFWNEIDIVYAGRTIVIPLLGSGITRFRGYDSITEQELLELLIWSFKVSHIKFQYPSKVKIVIKPTKSDKISLFRLSTLLK